MSVPPPPRKFFPPGSAPPPAPAAAAATEAPAAETVAAAPAAPAPTSTAGGPPPPPPGGPKATPPPPPPGGPSVPAAAPAASGVPPPPPPSASPASPAAAAPSSPAPPAIPTASRPPPPTPPPKPSMARPTPPHGAGPASLDVPVSEAQGPSSPGPALPGGARPAPPPRALPSSPAAAASPRVVPNSPAASTVPPAASPAPQSSQSPPPMPTISESQAGHSGGSSTLSPPTPGRGSFAAGPGGLPPSSPGSSGRGSFSGGPAPGEMGAKRASISHRPSLSMGSNGLMMPVKKEVSVNDMQQSIASQSPEEVAQALLDSEGEYVEGLKVCLDSFCLRLRNHIVLKRDLLSEMEILQLFGNIANIKNFNSTLYHDLVALYDESPQALLTGLGKVMIRFIPFFKLYTDYVKHHRENARMLTNKRQGSKDVEFFIQLNELSTGRNFQALLSSPANRLAQYLVYLGDIYAKIPHDTEVAHEYEEAIRKIQKVTDDIADFLKDQTARRLVVTVQCKLFDNTIEVVSSSRTVAKYGKVKVISDNLIGSGHSTEKVVLVLMNDMLLYGETATKLSKGKCKVVLQLSGMFAENFGNNQAAAKAYNDVPIDRCFRILTRSHKPLLFQCESTNARDQWLVALQETIDKYSSVMKRSIAPDQLQIACMSAEDFERTVLKKKVDKKAISEAAEKASKMAQNNKANPLPPSPGHSPPSQTRRIGGGSVSGPSSPPPQRAAVPAAPAAAPGGPPPPPMAPAVGPVTGSSAPPAPPMAPVMGSGAPAAPPMAPPMAPALTHAAPPPLPPSGGSPPPPGPPSAPGAPPAPSPSASASKPAPAGPNRNDLLSSIQKGGGLASLKKVDKNAPPPGSHAAPPPLPGAGGASSPIAALSSPSSAGKSGVDLNAALKSSLDRYRQFVQDEEEDDMDEWDE